MTPIILGWDDAVLRQRQHEELIAALARIEELEKWNEELKARCAMLVESHDKKEDIDGHDC